MYLVGLKHPNKCSLALKVCFNALSHFSTLLLLSSSLALARLALKGYSGRCVLPLLFGCLRLLITFLSFLLINFILLFIYIELLLFSYYFGTS